MMLLPITPLLLPNSLKHKFHIRLELNRCLEIAVLQRLEIGGRYKVMQRLSLFLMPMMLMKMGHCKLPKQFSISVLIRRAFLLACGGFPQYQLFRELGGEDGALGIATTKISYVATAFTEAGVLHYCRDGMHAERLLDAVLFNKHPENVTEEKMAQANAVTDNICQQITALVHHLKQEQAGIYPLVLTREDIA